MLTQHRLWLAAHRSGRSELVRRIVVSPLHNGQNCPDHYSTPSTYNYRHYSHPTFTGYAVTSLNPILRRVVPFQHLRTTAFVYHSKQYNSTEATASSTNLPPPNEVPKKRSYVARFFITSSLVLLFWTAGFAMAASPTANVVNGFLNAPTDAETLTLFDPPTPTSTEINERITNHPLAVKLRAQDGMTESRPHMKIPGPMRAHNFTGGTLLSSGLLEAPPLQFNDYDAELPTMAQIMYFGTGLCGHPGIVHGGMLATMLDEGLARACFSKLPNKFGVTASLKIDYRVPCPAGKYVVLKAQTTKVEGRKAWVKGWIELLGDDVEEGVKVVEAEALYIEPKGASTVGKLYTNGH